MTKKELLQGIEEIVRKVISEELDRRLSSSIPKNVDSSKKNSMINVDEFKKFINRKNVGTINENMYQEPEIPVDKNVMGDLMSTVKMSTEDREFKSSPEGLMAISKVLQKMKKQ